VFAILICKVNITSQGLSLPPTLRAPHARLLIASQTQPIPPLLRVDGIYEPLPALSGLLRRLRQKMAKNGPPDPVENVRGRGFRLLESIRLDAKAPTR
jgi:hypothetical protein